MTDNIDVLLRDLSYIDSGWHRIENPENGAVALFPKAAKSEAEWEERSITMHESQVPITIAPKPITNTLAARVVRAD